MKDKKEYTAEKLEMLINLCEGCNASAKAMLVTRNMIELKATPRESAMFRKQISDHDMRIADLQIAFNTFICTYREDNVGHLPRPSLIDIKQTKIRYGKGF